MVSLRILPPILIVILTASCRTGGSKSAVQGELIETCDASDDIKGNFALVKSVSDFSAHAALDTAKRQIIEQHAVPSDLRASLPVEIIDKCGNVDDQTITVRAGINLARYPQMIAAIKKRVEQAMDPKLQGLEKFKQLIFVNKMIATYTAERSWLLSNSVDVQELPQSAVVAKFKEMRDQTLIGLKFSENNFELGDGNVTRNIFKEAFAKMGLRTIDMENSEKTPDAYIAIQLRYEEIQRGNASGQQFIRLYATVAMEDSSLTTIAATTLEAKGGGIDLQSAYATALRSLEAKIGSNLLSALIPDQA